MENDLFRLVVLPCIGLCRSKIFHVSTVFDVLVFLLSIHFDHSGYRFILIKLIITILLLVLYIYMQLYCLHNDFSLNHFLSHCRHPFEVERSDC